MGSRPASGGRPSSRTGVVYVEGPNSGGKLRPVNLKTLLTDGNLTAVETDELKEGDEIVVGLATAKAGMSGPQGGPGGGGRRPF